MSYIGNEPVVQATRVTTELVATAGQTDIYPLGGYTPGDYLDVEINGAALKSNDYTATDGIKIVLAVALSAGDDIRVKAYGKFTIANSVQKTGDSMTGALGIGTNSFTEKLAVTNSALTSTSTQANTVAAFRSNASGADANIKLSDGVTYSATIGQIGGDVYFAPNGTERARITTTGQRKSTIIGGGGGMWDAFDCRAWVNFNGQGTVAIRGSGNVSSITDRAVGAYRVNFTTAMPDATYCISATAQPNGNTGANAGAGGPNTIGDDVNTGYAPIEVRDYTNTNIDSNQIFVAIHR